MSDPPPEWDWEQRRSASLRHRRAVLRRRRLGAIAVAAALGFVALASILLVRGDDESRFTTESFVKAVNGNGARLSLGDRLFSEGNGKEVWAIRLGEPSRQAGEGGDGTGGSLSVFRDTAASVSELRRCRAAGTLLCIRAENAILTLEEDARGSSVQRLIGALARLGGGRPRESG